MESQPCIFLGIKVKPGPIERHKLENFALNNTVVAVKGEAEKKINVPSASLDLIYHGKILKDETTLQDSGVKSGEMIHVVKKKVPMAPPPAPTFTDAELQQLNASLRTLGCTPNAPGWTRAMQLLNDESAMAEIIEQAPSLNEDCMTLSILHEVELLAALGANIQTMRRGANAYPDLPNALRHLTRLVRSRSNVPTGNDSAPTSGFAYSLEALSDDEEADEDDTDEPRAGITQEQLAAALLAATEAMSSTPNRSGGGGGSSGSGSGSSGGAGSVSASHESLLRLLRGIGEGEAASAPTLSPGLMEALSRVTAPAPAPMEHSTEASSSASPAGEEELAPALRRMNDMGLLDDALNLRALLICSGDVNAAINLVFSGAIGDD